MALLQVMSAPEMVINGKLEFTGVPSKEELKKKLGNKNEKRKKGCHQFHFIFLLRENDNGRPMFKNLWEIK